MSKKVINLGKVKGRTLDLKVDNKVLKKKYDDEIEWQELGKVGGIDTVNTTNDLLADAEQDDIAFVKEAAFVETVEYQEEKPIVLQGGQQILNIELRQEPLYLSEINFEETFPEFSEFQGENGYMAELGISGINGETSIMAVSYPASFMIGFLGIEQPVDMYQIMYYGNNDSMLQYHRLCGMSIKDYMTNMVEIPATEEQMQVLFGEHYNDKTEDNPFYEWIKVSVTEEPLNENSVFLDDAGAYVTVEFDTTVELKGLSVFEGYYFSSMKMGEEGPEEGLTIDGNLYDIEEHEKEEQDIILKFGNVLINTLYSGGLQDISYDVYTQKGFHKFDEGWKSLEEEMNIPKVVDTYSDLPKSFIENGFMAVANKEVILPEPTYDIDISSEKTFEVNPTPSVKNELDKIKQYFIDGGTEVDLENALVCMEGGSFNPITGKWVSFIIGPVFDDGYNGIMLRVPIDEDIDGYYVYSDEAGAEIYIPDKGSPQEWAFTLEEGGCWYYYELEERGKYDYLVDIPKKLTEQDWFSILDGGVMLEGVCLGWETEEDYDDVELSSYEFDNLFRFYDSSKTQIHPQGFYKYSKNRWHHQPDIAGASFDNEDLLKQITEEDLGNIELNTEARHEHNNKYYLDQIQWDFINKLNNDVPQNTNARHTHSNQYYLDQITDSDYVHKHSNKTILDSITNTTINNINSNTSARHSHTNQTYLDRVDYTLINNINSNTQTRHTHSNQYYLDQIMGSDYVHKHSNKGVLDAITNSTILDISNNKSARHSHTNKTILDKVTQTHLDDIHTHGNKELLDNINEDIFNKSHSHDNTDVLNKLSIDGDKFIVDGRELRKGFVWTYADKNAAGECELTPKKNTLYLIDYNVKLIKIFLTEDRNYYTQNELLEEFWLLINNGQDFQERQLEFHTNGEPIYFTNDMPGDMSQPILLKIQRRFYGYNITWYGNENLYYKNNTISSNERIWSNTQGVKYNYNYGLLTEQGLEFAPAYLEHNNVWYVNAENIYLEAGYKKLYGNTKPLSPMPPNTYEEFKVHQINDLIIIERNYIPYEIFSGYYVNSSYIKDFGSYFSYYSQEELNIGMQHGIDLSNAEMVVGMFWDCMAKTIPTIDLRVAKSTDGIFAFCEAETIEKLIIGRMDSNTFYNLALPNSLKNLYIEGKIKVNNDLYFSPQNLSIESILNFFETLEDNTNEEIQYTIRIGDYNLSKLSPEQIAIVTNKNILLA